MIASMWIGNLMLLIINLPLIGLWVRLLKVPYRLMFPAILMFCCIGIYSINSLPTDVMFIGLFGLVGYMLIKFGFEPAPLLLGFVLGKLMEENLRRALIISRGDLSRPSSSGRSAPASLPSPSSCSSLALLPVHPEGPRGGVHGIGLRPRRCAEGPLGSPPSDIPDDPTTSGRMTMKTTLLAARRRRSASPSPARQAQGTYPQRPITMIVPFAAGGPTDVIARIVGEHMSRTLGQQIVDRERRRRRRHHRHHPRGAGRRPTATPS